MITNLSKNTLNKDIGIFPSTSRIAFTGAITQDIKFSYAINMIKCVGAPGYVVWHNPFTEDQTLAYNVSYINLGETITVLADIICATKVVDGKTTDAETLIVMRVQNVIG